MKSNNTRFSLAILFILACALSVSGQDTAKKAPVPADAAQAEATKLVKEVYGDEWAKARTARDKQVLAKKLLGKAGETQDNPAGKFVLLRLARDIAAQASDGQTAFQAIDAMAETFEVNSNEMKTTVLAKLAKKAEQPPQHQSIAEEALKLAGKAVAQDNFTVADEFGKLALDEAQLADNNELLARARGQIAQVAGNNQGIRGGKGRKSHLGENTRQPPCQSGHGQISLLRERRLGQRAAHAGAGQR